MWTGRKVDVLGQGDSGKHNFKVRHAIFGNVVGSPKIGEHKIEVCEGTNVSISITDDTGTPFVTTSTTGISCVPTGCTINNIQETQRYRALSQDTKDKDNMFIIPVADEDL